MTMVLCLCFLICHSTFLLVAVFEKIVGTCSSTIYLRVFITITESALLTEENEEEAGKYKSLNTHKYLALFNLDGEQLLKT